MIVCAICGPPLFMAAILVAMMANLRPSGLRHNLTLVSTVVAPQFAAGRLELEVPDPEEVPDLIQQVVRNLCGHPVTDSVLREVHPDLPEPVREFWQGEGTALAARPRGGVRGAQADGDTQVSLGDLEFALFTWHPVPQGRTVPVKVQPANDGQRLRWVERGLDPAGETLMIPLGTWGLSGIDSQGAGTLDGWNQRSPGYHSGISIVRRALSAGEDPLGALVAMGEQNKEKKAKEARRAANRKAVEAAGLHWWDVPSNEECAENPEDVIEVTRRKLAEQAEKKAKEVEDNNTVIAERDAEVLALGLPEGYHPYCAHGNGPAYQVGIDDESSTVGGLHWYSSAEEAVAAARRHADKQAAKARRKAEREAWIKERGSPGLKDRKARGYNCQRRYMEERLNSELPGWTLYKWDGRPDWELKGRSCPTDAALELEVEAEEAGFKAQVHWAVWEARYDDDHEDDEYEAEVVVVEDFHGYLIYQQT